MSRLLQIRDVILTRHCEAWTRQIELVERQTQYMVGAVFGAQGDKKAGKKAEKVRFLAGQRIVRPASARRLSGLFPVRKE